MKIFAKYLVAVCMIALFLSVMPSALADETNNMTIVKFSAPFEVPGVGAQVLPAGTYVFKLVDSSTNRHIVQVMNEDQTHIFTTILAVPNYRARSTGETVMTFKERGEGQPEALRTWFYPNHRMGEEFVYGKSKALELAKIVNEPVFYTAEVATIEELKAAPIAAITPAGEDVAVAEVVKPEPVEVAPAEVAPVEVAQLEQPTLPQTGSYLPLIACFGLLSLGTAVTMKFMA